jgi:hypothetical protein
MTSLTKTLTGEREFREIKSQGILFGFALEAVHWALSPFHGS